MEEQNGWPISFPSESKKKIAQELFAAYKTSNSRLNRYLESPAAQRRPTYIAHLQAAGRELADDLYETERDYYQMSLWGDIYEFAKKSNISLIVALNLYLVGIIGTAMGMRSCVRAKPPELKNSCINSNEDLLAEVRASMKMMCTQINKSNKQGATFLKIIDFIQSNASDRQMIYLVDCDTDEVFLDFIKTPPSDMERVLSERKLALKSRRDFLDTEYSKNRRLYRAANEKNISTANAIASDLSAKLEGGSRSFTLSVLFGLYMSNIRIKFSVLEPIDKQRDVADLLNDPCSLAEMAADHLFWFSVFFIVMRDNNAFIGGSYADGATELLNVLFTSPSRIGRASCARTMEKVRAKFNHYFAPVLRDFSLEERKTDWFDTTQMPSAAHLSMVADHMGSLCAKRLKCGLSAEQCRAVRRILSELIIPAYDSILDQLVVSICDNQDIAGSITVENWLDALDGDAGNDAPEEETVVSFVPETPKPERCWRYVHNPRNGFSNYEELVYSEESHVEAFFRKKHIQSSIETGSIISAVNHFQGTDSCHKNLMIKECTGEYSWHKVKRGKARILIHEDDEGHLYVHVYPRKEWKYNAA